MTEPQGPATTIASTPDIGGTTFHSCGSACNGTSIYPIVDGRDVAVIDG